MEENVIENLLSCKKTGRIKNTILETYVFSKHRDLSSLKILVLNTPCNGFGDLIFAKKLASYMRDIYKMKTDIATTLYDGLITLGESPETCFKIISGTNKRKYSLQCRRFQYLKFDKKVDISQYDLIFIAPISQNQTPDLKDVQYIVPHATFLNTFTFSEYNDSVSKKFDFNSGVGKKREGLLFTDVTKLRGMPDLKKLKIPLNENFAIAYALSPENVNGTEACLSGFLEYFVKKHTSSYDIIVPPWINKYMFADGKKLAKKIVDVIRNRNVFFVNDKGEKITLYFSPEEKESITIRGDVLPVSNDDMIRLMRYSNEDILVTGDQSITDVLSTKLDKIIFYQIVHWKRNFASELARLLPDDAFSLVKTSCGTLKSASYSKNHSRFVANWDFRTITRQKFEAVFTFTNDVKKNSRMKEIYDIAVEAQSLSSLKKRIATLLKE